MFRMPRNLRKSIIIALLFSVIFPWTLMAEAVQQAPKNSLSYFLESEEAAKEANAQPQSAQSPQIIKTPEKISNEPQPVPGFEVAPPEPASEEKIDRFAAIEEMRARLVSSEAQSQQQTEVQKKAPATEEAIPAKTDKNKPETASVKAAEPVAASSGSKVAETVKPAAAEAPKPAAITEPAKTETAAAAPVSEQIKVPATEPEKLTAATDEYVPFAGVLARMQQNKAKRTAEAQKLGLVLPSQGGDIATVSPSLSKMNQAIRDIMSR